MPIYRTGQIVRLVVRVPANSTFDIKVKIDGKYYDIGQATSTDSGLMSLPAMGFAKPGVYPVAMIDQATGKTYYVKITIGSRR